MSIVRLIITILILSGVAFGGVFLAERQGFLAQGTLNNLVSQIAQIRPPKHLTENPQQITAALTSQVQTAAEGGQVLGASLVDRQEPPITQKAFEYARYEYCKAAITDYEQRFGTGSFFEKKTQE